MTNTALVIADRKNGILDLRINRPEARNSLNSEVIAALTTALRSVSGDGTTRCVILGGTGQEAFCAGADISELVSASTPAARRAFFSDIATLITAIHHCPVPVIGRVHGFALAGGCGLAAACDITLASEEAVFGLPEVAIGLAPMIVMAPIHRAIGRKALSELVLTGDRISAVRALEIGLVNRVYPKAALDEEAIKVCHSLLTKSPEALKRSKAALLTVSEMEYFPLLDHLRDESALLSLHHEACEGLKAFTEKRSPVWDAPTISQPTTSQPKE